MPWFLHKRGPKSRSPTRVDLAEKSESTASWPLVCIPVRGSKILLPPVPSIATRGRVFLKLQPNAVTAFPNRPRCLRCDSAKLAKVLALASSCSRDDVFHALKVMECTSTEAV